MDADPGGWHSLVWGLQERVLGWYLSAAPDAHLIVASFTSRRWRRALDCPMPREPHAVAAQLLAASPNGALFRWALAEARMPRTWLCQCTIEHITKRPDVRPLLMWLKERNALKYYITTLWYAIGRNSTLADLQWAVEERGWPLLMHFDESLARDGRVDKARWMHTYFLSVVPQCASTPICLFQHALSAQQAETAVWAWDELGVSALVDFSVVARDPLSRDRVNANRQLQLGALAGRLALVDEAAAYLRGHNTEHCNLVDRVARLAVANGHLDLVEWAWREARTHYTLLCPNAATANESELEALSSVVGAILCEALSQDAPTMLEWLWTRVDADVLGPEALRRTDDSPGGNKSVTAQIDDDAMTPAQAGIKDWTNMPFKDADLRPVRGKVNLFDL